MITTRGLSSSVDTEDTRRRPGGSVATRQHSLPRRRDERINWASSTPFLMFHAIPLLGLVTGVTTKAIVIALVLYGVRMFAITAGYHRYFAHRSYRVRRPVQFVMALLGTTAAQKGPLWWAAHHRAHHRSSDTDADIHSPQKGFWWSHVGWILCDRYSGTDLAAVPDLARYPELRFLDRYNAIGPWALAVGALIIGGWSGLVIGFFGSTVLLWHATFTVNSLNHIVGTRRYATGDTSRNNPLLALLTFGGGWHNNHHHYQASARQGFFWWELDLSWCALRALSALRVVRGLRQPSSVVLASARIRDGAFDLGAFRAAWRRAEHAVSLSTSAGRQTPISEGELHDKRAALERFLSEALLAAEDLAARRHRR